MFEFPKETMHYTYKQYESFFFKENRLKTFEGKWDPEYRVQPQDLASCWFYYIGPGDTVSCYYCKGSLKNWRGSFNADYEHRQNFPKCISHEKCQIPWHDDNLLKESEIYRKCTFVGYNNDEANPLDVVRLAREGYYYSGQNNDILCAFCQMKYSQKMHNPRCPRHITQNLTFCHAGRLLNKIYLFHDERIALGLLPLKDVFSDFVTKDQRLKTYKQWVDKPPAEMMADAGFILLANNTTVCYYCRRSINGWELDVDPYEEHISAFPHCLFIKCHIDKKKTLEPVCRCGVEADTVFLPCGHLKSCSQCAKQLEVCHICKETILATTKIFFA